MFKEKSKVIIDTDPGIDDALAILLLTKSPLIEVVAITTVAGNKDIQTVTNNAARILTQLSSTVPLYSGAAKPLKRDLTTGQVMGDSGLGNVKNIAKSKLNNLAVRRLLQIVNSQPQKISIVAIGPLTNIAQAIQVDPCFEKNVKEIIIMGGAIETYGNMNRVAEFNFFVDPKAAQIVINSTCKKTLIPLDRCYEVPLLTADFQLLKSSPLQQFVMEMIIPYIANLAQFEGQSGAIVYDALAAYFLLNPKAYKTLPMNIQIETAGKLTRGMCVCERRPTEQASPNVDVVTQINREAFKHDFLEQMNCDSP